MLDNDIVLSSLQSNGRQSNTHLWSGSFLKTLPFATETLGNFSGEFNVNWVWPLEIGQRILIDNTGL